MKIILRFLALVLTMTHVSHGDEDHTQKILDQLITAEDLHEKNFAIRRAREISSKAMNEALVQYLDDPLEDGPRQRDFKINAPWKSALGILLGRFPLKRMDHLYVEYNKTSGKTLNYSNMERKDADLFKKWWLENRQRIVYREDGTHFLEDIPSNESSEKEEVTKPSNGQIIPHTEKFSELTPFPAVTNDSENAVEHKVNIEKTVEAKKSNLPWIIAGVLLVGILILLLKIFKGKFTS